MRRTWVVRAAYRHYASAPNTTRQRSRVRARYSHYAPANQTTRRRWGLCVSYPDYASAIQTTHRLWIHAPAMAGTRHPWLKRTRFQARGQKDRTETLIDERRKVAQLAQSTGWCSRLACHNASTWRVPFSTL